MLERPDIPDAPILACLRDAFGVDATGLTFLPLGADVSTAVFRAETADGAPLFVKLRRGPFDELSVILPRSLSDQGVAQVIPPLATRSGQLWARLADFTLTLAPFVAGRDGYAVRLTERHWHDFGSALRQLHTLPLPPAIVDRLAREQYAPAAREVVRAILARLDTTTYADPVADRLAAFLRARRAATLDLVARAERLALALQASPPTAVVCHSDAHAGNILVDEHDRLFLVDWDSPILAPKERDLMFPGGGQGFVGYTAREEEELFFRGYGPAQVDQAALAYYRYERIVQDIAAYCEQLLLTDEGGADREQSLRYLMANYQPGGTIAVAYAADQTRR